MSDARRQEASGCWIVFGVILAIAAVVAAIISIATIVDPFSSLPSVDEVWSDCEEDFDTAGDDCELATRFPGFWGNVAASFSWVVAATASLTWLAFSVATLRTARAERFSGSDAPARYGRARRTLATAAMIVGAIAALPIVVVAV